MRQSEYMRTIARAVGRSQAAVRSLIAKSGGVRPVVPTEWSEARLSMTEREEISRGIAGGISARQIAAGLGRAPSTISREIAVNGGRTAYRCCEAEASARLRARRPKSAKLAACRPTASGSRGQTREALVTRADRRLVARRPSPTIRRCEVSHETIYMSLFVQGRGAGLRHELFRFVYTRGQAIRRPKGSRRATGPGCDQRHGDDLGTPG